MNKKAAVILLWAGLLSSAGMSVSETLAYTRIEGSTVSNLGMSSLKGEIREEYKAPSELMPGTKTDKKVNVKNTGSTDAVVRVKLEKEWGSGRNADGTLIKAPDLSTNNIELEVDDTLWKYSPDDGWYYYLEVLKPGEETRTELLKSFTVLPETGNDYKKKTADIRVSMECVQAGYGGPEVWGTSLEELGIRYEEPDKPGSVSSVVLKGPNGFSFSPVGGDLFTTFKSLIPGESRFQTTEIKNTSGRTAEIFLYARETDQDQATEETKELIGKLLKEYAELTITRGDTVIYQGKVWGNLENGGGSPASMKEFISLGSFKSGEAKELNLTLKLSPEMDNQYKTLLGKVTWVFAAEFKSSGGGGGGDSGGETRPVTPVDPGAPETGPGIPPQTEAAVPGDETGLVETTIPLPKTGDPGSIAFYLCMTAGFAAALLIVNRKKQEQKERKTE